MVHRLALALFLACCFVAGQGSATSSCEEAVAPAPDYRIARFLGLVSGKYWYAIQEYNSGTVRVWAFDSAKRHGGVITEHTEYFSDDTCHFWGATSSEFIARCSDGFVRCVEFATGQVHEGPNVGKWVVLGDTELIITKCADGVKVIHFDGTEVMSFKCTTKDQRVFWVTPTSFALFCQPSGSLTIVDTKSGDSRSYEGVGDLFWRYGNSRTIAYTLDARGSALRKQLNYCTAVAFEGVTMSPSPVDPSDLGFGPHYGLRAVSVGDGRAAMDFLTPAGEKVFRFYHGGRGVDWNCVSIACAGGELLRLKLSTASLWIYDGKTACDSRSLPLANLLCCSPQRSLGHLLMLFADGTVVDSGPEGSVTKWRIPIGEAGVSKCYCPPRPDAKGRLWVYAWNGSKFYKCGLAGELRESSVVPAVGSTVVMSRNDPLTVIISSRWTSAEPGERCLCDLRLFNNDRLFDAEPEPFFACQVALYAQTAAWPSILFWDKAGEIWLNGARITYRKSDIGTGDLTRDSDLHSVIGDAVLCTYNLYVRNGPPWGNYTSPRVRVFDYVRGVVLLELNHNDFGGGVFSVPAWVFPCNPNVLFAITYSGGLIVTWSRYIEGFPPLSEEIPLPSGTCFLQCDRKEELICLDTFGTDIGRLKLPASVRADPPEHAERAP